MRTGCSLVLCALGMSFVGCRGEGAAGQGAQRDVEKATEALTATGESKVVPSLWPGAHAGTSVSFYQASPLIGAPGNNPNGANEGAFGFGPVYKLGQHPNGQLGLAVAGGPSLMVVGQPGQNGGEVFWQIPNHKSWISSPGATGGQFGAALAVYGSDFLVGAPQNGKGSAHLYHVASDGTVTGPVALAPSALATGALFGYAVALGNGVAAVGAPGDSGGGSIRVFEVTNGVWSQVLDYHSSALGSLGNAIAIDGNTIVAGAWRTTFLGASEAGAAVVLVRDNGVWQLGQTLKPANPSAQDHFGRSVAVLGPRIVVGANLDDDQAQDAGAVYGFEQASGVWTQSAKIVASDGVASDYFGTSVALSNDTLLVGAWGVEDGNDADNGAYYQYTLTSSLGVTCNADADCGSGFCVDGVCCNTACGGGATDDCQACSAALGAPTDGTCAPIPDGSACSLGTCNQGACVAPSTTSSSSSASSSSASSTSSSTSASSTSSSTTASSTSSSTSAGTGGAGGSGGSGGAGGVGGAGGSGITSSATTSSGTTVATGTSAVTGSTGTSGEATTASGTGGAAARSTDATTGCTVSPRALDSNGALGVFGVVGLALVRRRRRVS